MSDVSADSGPPPIFGPNGKMMGNMTSIQGQPPQQPQSEGASALAPQSPLSALGPPPAPTAGQPPKPQLNVPPMPAQPQEKPLGPAPDAKEYHKGAMEFASAMAVLGAVADIDLHWSILQLDHRYRLKMH